MKKKSGAHSGIFHPRAILGFSLCLAGVSLAWVAFAQSRVPSRTSGAPDASDAPLRPTVVTSSFNGVSQPLRELAAAPPVGRTYEEFELPPVKAPHEMPADYVDPAAQQEPGLPDAMPTPGTTFEGLTQEESCGGCIPPDTTGAVGPSQYVQMTNSAFSVHAKNGTRLTAPAPINTLFQSLPANSVCRTTNNGDPIVVYDQLADRWLLSQFAFTDVNAGPWYECIAVSETGDATGRYYLYEFKLSTTKFHDYPHIALWPDGYYMMTHQFTPDGSGGFSYGGAAAIAFERDKMLNGQPAKQVIFDLGNLPAPFKTGYGGHLPANLDGFTLPPPGTPNYFVEVDAAGEIGAGSAAAMRLWKFHVDWANPANSTFGTTVGGVNNQPNAVIPVADFTRPPCSVAGERVYVAGCVPQLGDPSQLDPIGDRLMYRAVYRNFGDHEAIVMNHTVVVASGPNGSNPQMGPRWYEVRDPGGTPTLFQQSSYGPTGGNDVVSRFMGSIAFDRAGNIAIGYSASSATQFPSINYAGRLVTDPINTFAQGEGVLHPGNGAQHGEAFAPQTGRWGDYTTITVDPVDDCTFWYTNEYYDNPAEPTANWHTRIGSFKFPQCTPRPVGFLTGVVTDENGNPIAAAKVTAGGYTAVTGESGVFQFSPLAPGTYTVEASAVGYFPASDSAVINDGATTRRDFMLTRNLAEPTPAPTPLPAPLPNVNPPVLNDPGATVNNNHYGLNWSAAESTNGLVSYIVEESTDYTVSVFDNADGTALPGDAASMWTRGSTASPWLQDPAYHHSGLNSYHTAGAAGLGANSSLELKNAITIPAGVNSARLNFWSRFYNDGDDTGNVEVCPTSLNCTLAANWKTLRSLLNAPQVPPADTRMQDEEVDLTAYKGVPIKVRFRFSTGSLVYFLIRTLGWWVDDILLDSATWTPVAVVPANTTSTHIINRPNGRYFYRVRGVYQNGGLTAFSNVQDIIVNAPPTPQVVSVVSRKTHGSGGAFDVNLPLTGDPAIECRRAGSGGSHRIVFNFAAPVTVNGTPKAQVTSGTGSVSNVTVSGSEVTVDLTGVSNAQRLTVTLFSVSDGAQTGDVSAAMGVLLGDSTGDGTVNSADAFVTRNRSGEATDTNNFRSDVNTDGLVNSGDATIVRSNSGTSVNP